MCDLIKCDSCRCKPVCKECSNFELYVQQYLECRENSVLFDQDPTCPYYIESNNIIVITEELLVKVINYLDNMNYLYKYIDISSKNADVSSCKLFLYNTCKGKVIDVEEDIPINHIRIYDMITSREIILDLKKLSNKIRILKCKLKV